MTTPSLRVEAHFIAAVEDCWGWPSEVSSIYSTLNLALPSWCITGPYPFVSGQVLPLLSELSGWPMSLSADCRESHHTLAGVFNLTLSTVADIRSLIVHYGPLRSAVPFVSALIRVLAQICVSNGIVM